MSSSEKIGVSKINAKCKLTDGNVNEHENIGDWLRQTDTKDEPKAQQKLHEMGEALNVAENRCNTLKEQLEQVKSVYTQRTSQIDLQSDKVLESFKNAGNLGKKQLQRQQCGNIGTDSSGAAVLTINNILSGITNSINRLSELHSSFNNDNKIVPAMGKIEPAIEKKKHSVIFEEQCREPSSDVLFAKSSLIATKKNKKRRLKTSSGMTIGPNSSSCIRMEQKRSVASKKEKNIIMSTTSIKKRKRVKKIKLPTNISVPKVKHSQLKDSRFHSNHLVEIYHNKDAGGSESDDNAHDINSNIQAFKNSHLDVKLKIKSNTETPSLNMNEIHDYHNMNNYVKPLSPIAENMDAYEGLNDNGYAFILHNYEMPTIASKMKQVARGYLKQFADKSIPFCAAKSTTPSHNIGLNIQQVMNIIKNRQPIVGISPTLAHNIGIAADKINHNSLSAIVSSLGSRIGYRCLPCPMIKDAINYKHVHEVAKGIPEDIEEQIEAGYNYNPDLDEESPKNMLNDGDLLAQTNCTCLQKPGVAFKEDPNINQGCYQQSQVISSQRNNEYSKKIMQRANRKYKHIKSVYAQSTGILSRKHDTLGSKKEIEDTEISGPLKGKEKILKGVLTNLHDEFGQLANTYDELSKKIESNENNPVEDAKIQELEALEKKLNDKEEEIEMVMTLYSEVVTLKQQVKALRVKASAGSIAIEQQNAQMLSPRAHQYQVYGQPRNKEYKAPPAASHLTKLLRQIQAYQDVCKSGGK